jgi:hypothetical protein
MRGFFKGKEVELFVKALINAEKLAEDLRILIELESVRDTVHAKKRKNPLCVKETIKKELNFQTEVTNELCVAATKTATQSVEQIFTHDHEERSRFWFSS